MWILTILLVICSFSFYLSVTKNKRFEVTLPITSMSVILLLYVFGLFGILKYGIYAIYGISFLLYILAIIYLVKKKEDKNEFLKHFFTPGFYIFISCFLMFCLVGYFRMFAGWDEMSHWGSALKSMYKLDDLSTSKLSNLVFASYPPAITLFEYFFMKIKGTFTEGLAYIAYPTFILGIMLEFTKRLTFKNKGKIIITTLILIFFPMIIFECYYSRIFVDSAVGIVFGYGFVKILLEENKDKYDVAKIIMSLGILCLLKNVGYFLAIITMIYMFVDFLIKNKGIIKNKLYKNKKVIKELAIIIATIIIVLMIKNSWDIKVDQSGIKKEFDQPIDVKELGDSIKGDSTTDYRNTAVRNFVKGIINKDIISNKIGLKYFEIIILFVIALYLVGKNIDILNKNKKRYIISQAILIAGFLIYTAGLLVLYLFRFSAAEAVGLAEIERYLAIYMYGMLTVFTVMVIDRYIHEVDNNKISKLLITATVLIILVSKMNPITLINVIDIKSTKTMRIPYLQAEKIVNEKITDNKIHRIFIISQKTTNGFDYWALRQAVFPQNVSSSGEIRLGKLLSSSDFFTYDVEVDKWEDTLIKDYQYVYILSSDKEFEARYGSLFKDNKVSEGTLYKIEKNDNGIILVEA